MGDFSIRLTPTQAKVLFNVIDGAADAGACADGNTPQEARALEQLSHKLLEKRDLWKGIKLDPLP